MSLKPKMVHQDLFLDLPLSDFVVLYILDSGVLRGHSQSGAVQQHKYLSRSEKLLHRSALYIQPNLQGSQVSVQHRYKIYIYVWWVKSELM